MITLTGIAKFPLDCRETDLLRVLVKMAKAQAREARQWKRVAGPDFYAGTCRGAADAYLIAARKVKGYETQARSNNPLNRFAGIR